MDPASPFDLQQSPSSQPNNLQSRNLQSRRAFGRAVVGALWLSSSGVLSTAQAEETYITPGGHLQGEMAGEVTTNSVILQSRLTAGSPDASGDVPGVPGQARFEIADNPQFKDARHTAWLKAVPERDFIVKTKVGDLKPQTRYYYRLQFVVNESGSHDGPVRTFGTLAGDRPVPVRFVVLTCMNYSRFIHGPKDNDVGGATGDDKRLGYPALKAILDLKPDFFIGTGDNVYYDIPGGAARATTPAMMRKKWHEQYLQPRFVALNAAMPAYWEKDDHDTRYDDCDGTGTRLPTLAQGIEIFREQLPVVDPADDAAKTYRTHRITPDVQIWLTEGRDYRSPNNMPDGPEKTMWGVAQREWLKKSLLESTATFKLLVSPTGLVGPDDLSKHDNHVDIGGFRHEGQDFLHWAKEHGLVSPKFLIICGDRHWQYHSIHPLGLEEFGTGSLVTQNARMGVAPGAKNGTDPQALIKQPYTSAKPEGGFLLVTATPASANGPASMQLDFYSERGTVLNSVTKQNPWPQP